MRSPVFTPSPVPNAGAHCRQAFEQKCQYTPLPSTPLPSVAACNACYGVPTARGKMQVRKQNSRVAHPVCARSCRVLSGPGRLLMSPGTQGYIPAHLPKHQSYGRGKTLAACQGKRRQVLGTERDWVEVQGSGAVTGAEKSTGGTALKATIPLQVGRPSDVRFDGGVWPW